MDEKELLENIKQYIWGRGYYFDDETIYNYHISLKTRPFVILAGLSGTGKTKLSQLYAEALGQREHYKRLAVRPNWSDDRYLLGHFNTLTRQYITEPAVDFLLEAHADADNLYFLCLDEMNLAHIEYYFSQFLSAMEADTPDERRLDLFSKRLAGETNVPPELTIPPHLLFTGTINVDETTQSISDKVIDRANTIEFFEVDLARMPDPQDMPEPVKISALTWQSYRATKPDKRYDAQVIAINAILNKAHLGIGYRILREIQMYLANSEGLLAPEVAFDLQIKQRILPRIHGNMSIGSMLEELRTYMKNNSLPRSQQRLEEMQSRLKRDGYTSFWR